MFQTISDGWHERFQQLSFLFTTKQTKNLRACLHGGRETQVGEVTRLDAVEKSCVILTTPACRGILCQGYHIVAKHLNKQNGRQTRYSSSCLFRQHFMLWFWIDYFNYANSLSVALNCSGNCTV